MINGANNLGAAGGIGNPLAGSKASTSQQPGSTSFADVLKNSINEVSRLQQDATDAVNDLTAGKTENVSGVMTAVEKSDLAFKTLLAIRTKLMEAYDEIKGISV